MTKEELFQLKLPEFRRDIYQQIKEAWNALAKPLDGMGVFESALCTIGAVQETNHPQVQPRGLIIMCADNGIVARGVSQSGQEVTLAVAENMGQRKSSVCRMAAVSGTEVLAVDIGINSGDKIPGVQNRKVAYGTKDFLTEPAMTEDEVLKAIETGIELVAECRQKGLRILATGEMGIGNTTTSAAVIAALLHLPAAVTAGRGAGLDDAGLDRKRQVIEKGLCKYGFAGTMQATDGTVQSGRRGPSSNGNPPEIGKQVLHKDNPAEFPDGLTMRQEQAFQALRCLGGLDIAGLCGVFLGGAMYQIPVVVDGIISAAAALCAERLVPGAKHCFLASHMGAESAMQHCLTELELTPVIYGDLKLGEGTGAVMLFPLLDMAEAVYQSSSSFTDIGVAQYERYDV